jgi:hypothetical protein
MAHPLPVLNLVSSWMLFTSIGPWHFGPYYTVVVLLCHFEPYIRECFSFMKALTPAVAPLQLPLSQNLGEGCPERSGGRGEGLVGPCQLTQAGS